MATVPLIAPTLSPSGALHFAAVRKEATAQDIIDALSVLDEVKEDILGDLQEQGWAIQRILKGLDGRLLKDTNKLWDGLLNATQDISPLLASAKPPSLQRHFSAFPLSSHLHTPSIRLVSLHKLLRVTLSCSRIPDLDDDIELEWFLARGTTVDDVVNGVVEELGLTRAIAGPGGGNVDYVLEEVWVSDQGDEVTTRLPGASLMSHIVEAVVRECPFPIRAMSQRLLRFCVPDEWYRRSKSRSLSLTPIESAGTLQGGSSDYGSDEESGTAKQRHKVTHSSAIRQDNQESQSTRFSLFEGWGTVSSPPSGSAALARALPGDRSTISVSAPLAMPSSQKTGLGVSLGGELDLSEDNVSAEFERMMDEIGLRDDKREAMRSMPLDRKQYLLLQSKQNRSVLGTPSSSQSSHQASSQGGASVDGVRGPISPQVTGSGLLKRFSIWGSTNPSPVVPNAAQEPENKEVAQELLPIVPQITGSLWGNWWSGSPRETEKTKEIDRSKPKSTEWYVDGIRNGKVTDTRLAKHLISLRVHLSTAKVAWVERFLGQEKGMDALATLLQSLVGKGGKRRKLSDTEELVLLEVVKCLRVLLNTAPGYPYVIQSPNMVTHIAFTLHGASPKLRALSSDLLAAICVISLNEGHRLVLGALSDYKICFDEAFRFEDLINAIRIEENVDNQEGEDDGSWEARGATMGLIIALTSCSDSLEDRILLREEFSRRGLNEIMVGLRYLKPPDALLKQLDAYAEDKYEDEDDMRDQLRTLGSKENGFANTTSEEALDIWLKGLERSSPESYASLQATLKAFSGLLDQATASNFKVDVLFICRRFVENIVDLNNFEDQWATFLDQFAQATHHLIPHPFSSVKEETDDASHRDIKSLQEEADAMSEAIKSLQSELAGQTAELNALRSLSQTMVNPGSLSKSSGKTGGNAEIRGLVTRLVQKEKQVAQLQVELENARGKSQHQIESEEQAKRERERLKVKKVTEELSSLKLKNAELEGTIAAKAKEIVYLKRALESVYSRFHANAQESELGQDRHRQPESEVDVQSMTNHTIEGLAKKEEEIKTLQDTVKNLKAQLSDGQSLPLDTSSLEKQFKARVAPPPPPPPLKPKKSVSNAPNLRAAQESPISPTSHSPTPPVLEGDLSQAPVNIERLGDRGNPPAQLFKVLSSTSSNISKLAPISSPPSVSHPVVESGSVPYAPEQPPSVSPAPVVLSSGPPPPPPAPPFGIPPPPPPPPPAPPFGLPPPPAPPAPAFGAPPPAPPSNMPTRRPTMMKVPSKKLKPFFWTKFAPVQAQSTVWDDLREPPVALNMKELEEIFTVDTSAGTKTSKSAKDPTKNQSLTTLLDITRATNVAIMLTRIKLSNSEIRKALLELDDTRLSTDDLRSIARQLPTLEEINRIRDFGDIRTLSKSDQYFGEIMQIPRLPERLECLIYRRRLDLELAEVKPDLNMVRNAGAEIKASKRLRRVLGTVLAMGNALNGNTFRGGARGFQLDALLKMKETKTANAGTDCPTLLHYLAKVLMREDAGLIMFSEELPHVEAAARVSVQFVVSTVNSLCQGMERLKDELTLVKNSSSDASDLFAAKMQPFLRKMEPAIQALQFSGQALEAELRELLSYFGESLEGPDGAKPEDFFNLVLSFSRALQKAALEVHEPTAKKSTGPVAITVEGAEEEHTGTIKGNPLTLIQTPPPSSYDFLSAPPSQGRAAGRNAVGRGDVDQAIRSIRDGQRRARPSRPLSKMFLDGTSGAGVRPISRAYD